MVIVGGGFGGLYAAQALAEAPIRITLVDRQNHHLFQPLLYQVATAALSPADIAQPIRRILRHQGNVEVVLGDARAVDVARRRLKLGDGALEYDYLIVATGAGHSYFGRDEWAVHAPGLKTIDDALEVRRRVLTAYEAAEREGDPERRRAWLNFVVVGAGPTGVELAGALAEIAQHAMARDFRHIDPTQARVILVEGQDRVLAAYPPPLSAAAAQQLRTLGVEIHTGSRVTAIDDTGVSLGDERIPSRTVLWAAGLAASPLARSLGVPLDRAGRVLVGPTLTIPGHEEVFVIGDLAHLEQDGQLVPGVAPAAIQEGRHAAKNIEQALVGQPLLPFRYRDKGSLATIGRAAAVAMFGRFSLRGFAAWLAWLAIHILFLIGFRNRLFVMLSWAWSFLTFQRGSRLITGRGSSDRVDGGRPPAQA